MANDLIKIVQPNYNSPTIIPSYLVPDNLVVGSGIPPLPSIPAEISSLTNLRTYFDFSQWDFITIDEDGFITNVRDLSGHDTDASSLTPGTQPTYALAYQNGLNTLVQTLDTNMVIANSLYTTPQSSVGFIFKTPSVFSGDSMFLFNAAFVFPDPSHFDCYIDTYLGNKIFVTDGGQGNVNTVASTTPLTVDTWYTVVTVWNSLDADPTKRGKIYVNGLNDTTNLLPNGSGDNVFANPSSIGYSFDVGHTCASPIGEMFYTNGAITPTQVANLHAYWASKWNI